MTPFPHTVSLKAVIGRFPSTAPQIGLLELHRADSAQLRVGLAYGVKPTAKAG